MRIQRSFHTSVFSDSLEQRITLSAANSLIHACPAVVSSALSQHVHDPLPNPEPDPGDLPTDDPPIIYPPIPPSGPVGPGVHLSQH